MDPGKRIEESFEYTIPTSPSEGFTVRFDVIAEGGRYVDEIARETKEFSLNVSQPEAAEPVAA